MGPSVKHVLGVLEWSYVAPEKPFFFKNRVCFGVTPPPPRFGKSPHFLHDFFKPFLTFDKQFNVAWILLLIIRTAYAKGFNKESTTLDELLDYYNESNTDVVSIQMRNYCEKKGKEKVSLLLLRHL